MGKLIYSAITSLDGFTEDGEGSFDWAEPDEEVFRFVNEIERPIGTYLYGRRMYETMVYWGTVDTAGQPAHLGEFASMWKAADKIVYSTSLGAVSSTRTRIERTFDAGVINELKAAQTADITVAGPNLADQAFEAGLVDECQLFLTPVAVGTGKAGTSRKRASGPGVDRRATLRGRRRLPPLPRGHVVNGWPRIEGATVGLAGVEGRGSCSRSPSVGPRYERHDRRELLSVKRDRNCHEATAALGPFGSVKSDHLGLLDPPDQK